MIEFPSIVMDIVPCFVKVVNSKTSCTTILIILANNVRIVCVVLFFLGGGGQPVILYLLSNNAFSSKCYEKMSNTPERIDVININLL